VLIFEQNASEMWDVGFLDHRGEHSCRPDRDILSFAPQGRTRGEEEQTHSRLPQIRKVDANDSLQVSRNVHHSSSSIASCFL